MNRTRRLVAPLVWAAAFILIVGCGQQGAKKIEAPAGKQDKDDDHGHSHGTGPHGGAVAHWGGGKYHVEFTVSHPKQEATIYVLRGDVKTLAPIKVDKLLLTIKEPSFQVELRPVPQEKDPPGTSSRFVGKHEKLGKEQEFAGTISGEVAGKPYVGEFKEEPEVKK